MPFKIDHAPNFSPALKKGLLILLFTSILLRLQAADLYWVGGSGNWHDVSHWSLASGGKPGNVIPASADDAIFDANSFSGYNHIVYVDHDVFCNSIQWHDQSSRPEFLLKQTTFFHLRKQNPLLSITFEDVKTEQSSQSFTWNIPVQHPPHDSVLTQAYAIGPSPQTHTCTASIVVTPLCPGQCNGVATVNMTPAVGNYTFLWNNGQTTQTATGLCAGQGYNVLVGVVGDPNDNCLSAITFPNYAPFNAAFSNVSPLCNSQCNGSSTVFAVGGTTPYTYSWSNGQTTQTATGLCATTYTITITDANSCTFSRTVTITQPNVLGVSPTGVNILCNGSCTGSVNANATGGTTPYNYSWSSGCTVASCTGLCAGTYTFTVTDNNGCTASGSVTLTQPPPLTLSTSTTNNPLLCNGNCNATATATAGGGVSPYSYSWNPTGQTTQTATGLCANTYTVTITDANGCTKTASVNIVQPTLLGVTVTGTNLNCANQCIGTATATVTGGTTAYSYSWNTIPVQTTNPATGLCAGTYTVTVTDANGCTKTAAVTITQPPPLTLNITTTNSPLLCFGNCNATATANAGGGTTPYTYSWNTIPVQTTQTATGLCAGTYTVTVTDSKGCTITQAVTINQPTQLTVNTSFTSVLCNGQCNGTATANANGGTTAYTYSWNPSGQTTQTATGLCAGTFTVTVTDANGCTKTASVNVTQPTTLGLTVNGVPSTVNCNGDCNATVTSNVTGGTAPYTYNWSSGCTTATCTGVCAGTYTLTVTDSKGCTRSASVTINQPTALTGATAQTNPVCAGQCNGTACVIAGGGTPPYTYLWTPGNFTTNCINNLCAGTYTVTITDSKGCTKTATVSITTPPPLGAGANINNNVLCAGQCNGSATANATGGVTSYTYLWQPGAQTTQTVTNLCAGTYTVTVTDANGCTATQSIQITQPPVLSASITGTTSSCNICNGTATISVSGGTSPYSFNWNTTPVQTTATATGLCPGSYTCVVTDNNGCTTQITVTILQTVQITVTTSGTSVSCFGSCNGTACAIPTGGQSPYTYLWNSTPVQTTQCATGLCAGSYTVFVTDVNGCFNSAAITFVAPPLLTASTSQTDNVCNAQCAGTATITASGGTTGYTYLWNPGGQTTQTATALCAGTYTATVTDANGCTATSTVTITQPPPITQTNSSVPANCSQCDGTATVTPTGGAGPPYTYLWTPSGQTTQTATALCAGAYTVTITDVSNCTASFLIGVGNASGPTVTTSQTNLTCPNVCIGTATVTVTAGTTPFSYSWSTSPVQTTSNATGLCAGVYIVTVTDGVNCITTASVNITQPNPFNANASIVNSSGCTPCTGSITTNMNGGTTPYSYAWAPGGETTSSITGLCAGTYTLTVQDVNSCQATFTYNITSPQSLNVSSTQTNELCNGDCNGTASISQSGGTPPYTYSWNPNVSNLPNAANLCAGNYTVTVTDANNCSNSIVITITQPPALTITPSQTNVNCNTQCNGTATATVSGGTGTSYTYSWNPTGQSTSTATALCPAVYTVTVTDGNGCTATQSYNITQPAPLGVTNIAFTSPSCNGGCNGTGTATVTGGTTSYTYSWSNGETTNPATALCGGIFTLTVTDANGCTANQTVNVTQPNPLAANPASTNPTCPGGCNGQITVTPSGGTSPYSYGWSNGGTTATVTGLCTGTYTVTITDANSCTMSSAISVAAPPTIGNIASVAQTNCGFCTGTISLITSGGTSPYSYAWTPNVGNSANVTGLCAGLYFVTVTDANGCTDVDTIPLSNANGPTVTSFPVPPICFGSCNGSDSVFVTGTTPFTYLWTAGGATTASESGLCSGVYFCTVTDGNGCITIITDTLNQPGQVGSTANITNATCSGICDGAITLTPSGGTNPYTYSWTGPNAFTSTNQNINSLCVGTYTVTITDINGCTGTSTFTVNGNIVITGTIVPTNVSCNSACNGSATVTPSGGVTPYTYSWAPSGGNAATANSLCAGTYTVTITDNGGCNGTATVTIAEPPPLGISMSFTDPLCNGNCNGTVTATVTGGTTPYSYAWLPGGQTTASLTGLCSGTYTLTVTDVNTCTASQTVTLTDPALLGITGVATNASCSTVNDGSVTTTATGGTTPYTYLWSNGQTTANLSNVLPGNYTVTVTDVNNCTATASFNIGAVTTVVANAGPDTSSCQGGSIQLCGSGSLGATSYLWLDLSLNNIGNTVCVTVSPLVSTSYMLIACNGTCCDTDTVAVTIANPPVCDAGSNVTILVGSCTTLNATGGVSYAWTPGGSLSDSTIANPVACPSVTTTYYVIVTNGSGCTCMDSVTVTVLPQIVIPNGISPNNDGQNDYWIIDNIQLFPDNVVEVYNRWGELLYRGVHYDNVNVRWDGHYKGKDLPVGSYYYIIDLHDDKYPEAFTGPITILR